MLFRTIHGAQQDRQCNCNITLWRACLVCILPQLSLQPNTISVAESSCVAI